MISELTPQPFPKKLLNQAKELGFQYVELSFSGGSDEGCLDVHVGVKPADDGIDVKPNPRPSLLPDRYKEIADYVDAVESWAWTVYDYNGAGDGTEYGDEIKYDFETNEVTIVEWFMERIEGDTVTEKFETCDEV